VFKNKSIFLRFRLHFLPDMPKLVSNFRKIVRQRWEMLYGFVGNLPGFPAVKEFGKSVKN